MKQKYAWKKGSRISIPAQKAGDHMEALRRNLGGGLTAKDILDDARNARSPLHGAFEWNDHTAAERQRLDIAGHLLGSLVVIHYTVQHPKEKDARTFPHIRAYQLVTDKGVRAFQPTITILSKPALRKQLIASALNEFTLLRNKYRRLRELNYVFDAIDQAAAQIKKPTSKAAAAASASQRA